MIRRRRRAAAESFSLDSFLDLVTNIVGIIIRLIMVAWVGAKSYDALPDMMKKMGVTAEHVATGTLPEVSDPLEDELARQKMALAEAEAKLLAQLRQFDLVEEEHQRDQEQVASIDPKRQDLDHMKLALERAKASLAATAQKVRVSLDDLVKRRETLTAELKELEKLPVAKKALRYRVPVSQTIHAGEYHFECKEGRVTFVDLDALVSLVVQELKDKEAQLKDQWQVSDVTDPIGAFRLRYAIERRRGNMDAAVEGVRPETYAGFSYGLAGWQLEPVSRQRGETAEAALREGAEFRRLVEGLAVEKAAVTLWVYPDSFPLYRQLRDYLADLGLTVAGRPLPPDALISASPKGTKSRGQ